MVALVPMQAIAGAALAALGPLHQHRPPAKVVVLEDFRRIVSHARSTPSHVATAFGHFHGSAPERHHHDRVDLTVIAVDDGTLDGEAGPAGAALAAAVALCSEPPGWQADGAAHVRASSVVWAPLTHDPPPLERPPRAA